MTAQNPSVDTPENTLQQLLARKHNQQRSFRVKLGVSWFALLGVLFLVFSGIEINLGFINFEFVNIDFALPKLLP